MKISLYFLLVAVSLTAVAQSDFEKDKKQGDEYAKVIESQMGIVDAPQTTAYIDKIGQRLVNQLDTKPFPFTFQIVDQGDPNAFSIPGGHVYVSRGLLALVQTEDELAGVIGHEIMHIMHRHSARQQRKAIIPGILALPGALLASAIGMESGPRPLLGLGKVYLASYGRKQEDDADNYGIKLAAKAGYEPAQLAIILQRLEKEVTFLVGQESKFSMFDDHPMTPDRIKKINATSSTLNVVQQAPFIKTKGELFAQFNDIMVGENPKNGAFLKNTFVHPELNIAIDFPEGWRKENGESAVGASSEKKSVVALTVAGRDYQRDTAAVNFVNNYYSKSRMKPTSDEKKMLKGVEVREIIFSAPSSTQSGLYTLFIPHNGYTYLVYGLTVPDEQNVMRESAKSFRALSAEERNRIEKTVLQVAISNQGESIDAFSSRSQNVLVKEFLQIINDLQKDELEAMPIKIAVRKPY
ncbi:MAG: M48 family metalloprotease [Flammeovirgaceae bacterium]|nr:M48 family metalloprotease [Flammeovirgaceae bacterium]